MNDEDDLKYPPFIINLDLSKEEHVRFKAKMDKVIYNRGKHNLLTFGVEENTRNCRDCKASHFCIL